MENDTTPDPRSNRWTPKDDALVFYIFATRPFVDIKRNAKLLPHKTTEDIYSRFQIIMKNKTLQTHLSNEFPLDNILKVSLPFSESEIYSLNRIIQSNPTRIIKTIACVPYLFNPAYKSSTIARELLKMQKKSELLEYQDDYNVQQYLNFVKKNCKKRSDKKISRKSPLKPIPLEKLKKKPLKRIPFSIGQKYQTFDDIEALVYSKFQQSDLGALIGFFAIHKIVKTRIMIGRQSTSMKPEVDLTMYDMQSVSRKHCFITFCSDGRFYLTVLGREALVNGIIFYRGQNIQLKNRDLIDVGGVPLLFFENPTLREQINELCTKNQKPTCKFAAITADE